MPLGEDAVTVHICKTFIYSEYTLTSALIYNIYGGNTHTRTVNTLSNTETHTHTHILLCGFVILLVSI